MITDPILKEIHQNRENLARKFNFDIRKIIEDAKKREMRHKERVVNLQVKRNKLANNSHDLAVATKNETFEKNAKRS